MSTGSTLILLDLPPKTFVGINLSTFNSSPKFHGVSRLPSGLNFTYTGTDAGLSIRHGQWLNITSPNSVDIFKWNAAHEHIELIDPTSEIIKNIVKSIPALQKAGLVDYTALREASQTLSQEQDSAQAIESSSLTTTRTTQDIWATVTSFISPRTLSRIIASSSTTTPSSWTLTSLSSSPTTDSNNNKSTQLPEIPSSTNDASSPFSSLALLPIDLKRTFPPTSTGRERTDAARDRSWYLFSLLFARLSTSTSSDSQQQLAAREFLAELQFTFLAALTLANYDCAVAWRNMLSVVFTCRSSVSGAAAWFAEVCNVLVTQLEVLEREGNAADVFELGDEGAWLKGLLREFREIVEDVTETETGEGEEGSDSDSLMTLRTKIEEVERKGANVFGWVDRRDMLKRGMVMLEDGEMVELQVDGVDEDEETGDWGPVVVET